MHLTLLIAGALALVSTAALAADTAVDLSPVLSSLTEIAAVVLTAVGVWLARRVSRWLGVQEDDRLRGLVEDAIANGIAYAADTVRERVARGVEVDVRSALVADAADYVVDAIPDTLRRFGITPAQLDRKIRARLSIEDDETVDGDGGGGEAVTGERVQPLSMLGHLAGEIERGGPTAEVLERRYGIVRRA